MNSNEAPTEQLISITPLLRRLWPSPAEQNVTAPEIAAAISLIFDNRLSPVQIGALLTALHFTGWDRRADVIAQCAAAMRRAACPVDLAVLRDTIKRRDLGEGRYEGGLCDIVGTGGDSHNTFNVSTTASLICSALLLMSKHGNRASTSSAGSADLLANAGPSPPNLHAVNPTTLPKIYNETNYAFLFAPVFHPGMRYVTPIRRDLGWRTIFNLLGPLTNPVEDALEARVIGIARRDLGPVFAEALRLSGSRKALVVCGEEDLDEISCAGRTYCWMLQETDADASSSDDQQRQQQSVNITHFTLHPSDFGLSTFTLKEVSPASDPDVSTGANATTNAGILRKILLGQMPENDAILSFVLMNAAALLVISGLCEADTSRVDDGGDIIKDRGPGGMRWKEGVRRARWAISSGKANEMWEKFIKVSRKA